tara:strand:- start:9008 stop:10372 length:1365 start_codon:yes stop_codon:yes gene_type:complete
MPLSDLTAISPIDGRYSSKTSSLRAFFSEFALMKYRLKVEVEWFIFLSLEKGIKELAPLSKNEVKKIRSIYENFSLKDSKRIKSIENKTNHDVKAIEYFLKEKIKRFRFSKYSEFIHFACTSEDINNLSYSLMIADASQHVLSEEIKKTIRQLRTLSKKHSNDAMLSRTHGQPASPTTMGKELSNFVYRIDQISNQIGKHKLKGKMNGAVGNFNAHKVAYPKINWEGVSKRFVNKLGLTYNPYTTQIEPKDNLVELFHHYHRLSNVLIDLSRDVWGYISLNYFSQVLKEGEVGSSTMPHKVNPIDFENAEGNLTISKGLFYSLSDSIQISRWQRDLSDSTSMRNVGVGFSHFLIALKSLQKGLGKLKLNKKILTEELNNSLEVLTEAVQTIIRKNNIPNGYEVMKDLSRGKEITEEDLINLIDGLDIPDKDKNILSELKAATYTGLAYKLSKDL